jgi:signal transduction histidine kinase/ligand-binding sensor domain-containing protein
LPVKKLTFYILLIFLCCFSSVRGQQLYFNHLSVNNGLSQGVNKCIYRDSKGFVWISSYDGLNRFDGVNCISFRSSDNQTNGLKGTLFLNILEDKNSNLWIGSNAGLNFYNRRNNQFQNFRIEGRSNDEQFYSPFYIDDKNNIWLQSNSDIFIFSPENNTITSTEHFFSSGSLIVKPSPTALFQPLQKIYAIYNNLPELWLGQVRGEKINWVSSQLSIPENRITAILPSGNSNFWIGTNNGLYLYQNNLQVKCINRFANKEIKDISTLHLDQNGTLWAGTLLQGLFKIDTTSATIIDQYLNSAYDNYALSGNQVQYINTDEKGILWVSVWGKGVDYTSINKFRFSHHVTKEEAVRAGVDNFIRSIVQINNEFWCGTQSNGILILDENKKIKQSFQNGLPLSIEHLYLDDNRQIWAATFEGLYMIDPLTKKVTKLPVRESGYDLTSNQYNYISGLKTGAMLASTNAGLFIIEKTNKNYHIKQVKGLSDAKDVFLTTYIDKLDQLYISRAFKGFTVYQINTDSLVKLKEFPMEASIKCFSESADSNIWIGSTNGLIQFNKYKLQVQELITTNEGLSNQYIYGIVSEGNHLWLSTNAGINRFDIRTKALKTFSSEDGLQSNEFNTYSSLRTNKGEFLFGGVNGLNSFFPSDLKNNSYTPQLILTGIQINDTSYRQVINPSEIKELKVDYQQNTIGFQFSVIHYANAAASKLSYLLEGYDKKWVTVASNTLIRYTNLPNGHYILKVKAINADGIEADNIYSLPILVRAPWWKSWWFRLLSILTLLGSMHFVSRSYLYRRLEKQRTELEKKQAVEKERNRISRDMHDDLGSGLTMIAILSEVVKKQLADPEKAKESLEKIAVSSRYLVDNLQDIIWVLNPQNDNLESLSSYIREYGLKYFEPMDVQIEFNFPEQFSNRHLGEEQRRNMFLTVKESFNNIAKYAWCNKVTVTIQESASEIRLCVEDDGNGFDVNKVRLFANGLKNMQNRIEQVGGSYSIISNPGSGTVTVIKLRL